MTAIERPADLSLDLQRASQPNILLIVCVAIGAWLVLVPVAALLVTAFTEDTGMGFGAFTFDNFVEAYASTRILRLFANSVVYALGTAVVTFFIGGFVAWAVERTDAPGRTLFHNLALLSFAVPGLLMAMAWIFVLSPNIGWVNAVAKSAFHLNSAPVNIYTMAGMIWALSSHYFPLAYLAIGPALRALDVRMEEAGLMSGGRYWHVLPKITLPLLRPAILSGLLLLFIMGMSSYEVPRLIGRPARIDVFTTEIQSATVQRAAGIRRRQRAEPDLAADLHRRGLFLSPRHPQRRSLRHHHRQRLQADPHRARPLALAGGGRHRLHVPDRARAAAVHARLAVVLPQPVAAVHGLAVAGDAWRIIASSSAIRCSSTRCAPASWSPPWRRRFVVALTLVMAWMARRSASRFAWLLDALASAPIAIPSVIVGASILFTYLVVPIPIYNTIWILFVAYVTLCLPYGMRFASSGITQIHRELEEAASVSGATLGQIFLRVLFPLILPFLLAAWIYVFVLSVRELGASVFLVGPGTSVLGTVSLTMWEEGGSYGAVAALGVLQILPLLVIVAGLRWLEMRVQRRGQDTSPRVRGEVE